MHALLAALTFAIAACDTEPTGPLPVPGTPISLETNELVVNIHEVTLAYQVAREELARVRPEWRGDPAWDFEFTQEELYANGHPAMGVTYPAAVWSRVAWNPRVADTAFQHELFHVWLGHWTSTYDPTHKSFPEVWDDADHVAPQRLRMLWEAFVITGAESISPGAN